MPQRIVGLLAVRRRQFASAMYEVMTSMSRSEQEWYTRRAREFGEEIRLLEQSLRRWQHCCNV